ncbi:MAG: sugar ABC transporter permease [Chloroflexi bacterium]|nr:sugar ABC transporter permease [Chloroflexota bacterium]MCC6891754.1 sugar ABC transporter permease [Anaerolineae bacterium]
MSINLAQSHSNAAPVSRKRSEDRAKPYYRTYVPYLFLIPGLLLYFLWTVYPLIYQLYISFFDWKIMPGQVSEFVGLANYQEAFADKTFWLAMRNTAGYAIVTVAGQMIVGLALAILVHRVVVGKRFFRTIYYLPVVTSWIVVSFLFIYLFSPGNSGLVNYILLQLGTIDKPISWMAGADTAWIAIYSLGIWKGMGWAMVIFLAALQGIPTELYEAAAIDGADEFGRLRFLTIPLIKRTLMFVFVALMIGGFQVFLSVLMLTGGGPLHRTEVALTYMFDEAFGKLNFGYGAALSYILAIVIVIVSVLQTRLFGRQSQEVEY